MKQKHIFIAELLKGRDYVAAGELLHKDLVCMDSVVLDFTGVEGVPTMFWNVSLLPLVQKQGKTALKKIRFTNITRSQADRIKDYVAKIS